MSRRTNQAAEAAAAQASEAARVLQARQQESKASEPKAEPAAEPKPRQEAKQEIPEGRLEALRNNNPRHKALESIVEKRGGDEDEAPTEPAAEPAKEPAAKPEAAPAAAAPTEPAAPPEAPKVVRVKVDGEEFDAPAEEVEAAGGVHAYQRDKASDRRLQRANEALAEAKRLQASAQEMMAKHQAPAVPEKSIRQLIAEKSDVIRFGTPEEMAEALEGIITSAAKPVDQKALTVSLQAEIDHTAAVRQFDKENADLVKNPVILHAIASLRDAKFRQHQQQSPGMPIDWQKFYSTISHEVRGAFGRQSQPTTPAPQTASNPSQPSEKEARKASITNLPTAAARAAPPQEEKPLSPEEERKQAIAEMRKRRGQAAG